MKTVFTLGVLLFATPSFAAVSCKDLQDEKTKVEVVQSEGNVLTRENWKTIDVVLGFNFKECSGSMRQELIKVKGETLWRFTSNDDSCDGGNSYGSIYSEDLKTPIAHIYDSDVTCEEDWQPEYMSKNHTCDLKAEAFAQKKMKAFGLDFQELSSTLELREPYIYSYIRVSGNITNKKNKTATVNVLTNVKNCKMSSATIEALEL